MKKNTFFWVMIAGIIITTSCNKKDKEDKDPEPTTTAGTFEDLTFSSKNAYFSTDGSMTAPVDSVQAKKIASKIDITYIYNYDYSQPGFFEPVSRSQVWYWDDYYKPWLSTSVETRFYVTTLTKSDFDAAKTDRSKIATYFANTTTVLAPHGIFPTGSCIGGRKSYSPDSELLGVGAVYGFKNTTSGKRGLLYIRTGQSTGWPYPILNDNTKVDIVKEN